MSATDHDDYDLVDVEGMNVIAVMSPERGSVTFCGNHGHSYYCMSAIPC